MQAAYFLTGYNEHNLTLVDPITAPEEAPNILTALIDKYVDMTGCEYDDEVKINDGPSGSPQDRLEGSDLLCQLPWMTPWADLFEVLEPVKVIPQNNK
jgi:hypothetical protein